MSLDEIQKDVDAWTGQFTPPYWPPFRMVAKLYEEGGEVARALDQMYTLDGIKKSEDTNKLGEELVDLLFAVCCIANSHNINLQEAWTKMMQEKRYGRDNNRFERKS